MPELDPIDEIKRRLNIVEVISGYVPLKKAGKTFKGLCPFHAEKKPSFTVSPDKGVFHCFGCGAGGDLFSFIMKKEGMEFPEALQFLADRAGVKLERQKGAVSSFKKKLLYTNQRALNFFQQSLENEAGREARRYLEKRGIKDTTIRIFHLGFAPSTGLLAELKNLGLSNQQLTDWGLAVEREGALLDKFRHRLVFPIADHLGRIVAFTGRALREDDEPKYLNSPETLLFVKGRVLYGLDLAKEEIGRREFVVAVEGQMDVISSYQSGVKNVVAISGTAFTSEQAELLARYAKKIILAFDSDEAGREATKRSLPILSQAGFVVKVAKLPDKDPDAVIQKDPRLWEEALKEAQPAVQFFLERAKEEFGFDSPLSRQKVAEAVEEIIAMLADPVERELYINSVASELGVGVLSLKEAVRHRLESKGAEFPPKEEEKIPTSPPVKGFLENKIFSLLVAFPENISLFLPELEGVELADEFYRHIYTHLSAYYTGEREETLSSSLILESLPPAERIRLAERVLVAEEEYNHLEPEEIRTEIAFYIRLLKDHRQREKRQGLIEEIAQAEQKGDQETLKKLLQQFREK